MDLQRVQDAIEVVFNPHLKQQHADAERFLEEVGASRAREDPYGWRLAAELAYEARSQDVLFWSLQYFERFLRSDRVTQMSSRDRQEMNQFLVEWVKEHASETYERNPLHNLHFCKSKFALVYALAIIAQYPDAWSDAFTSLIALSTEVINANPDGLSMKHDGIGILFQFLKIVEVLDDEVVNRTYHRSVLMQQAGQRIKDAMRDQCIGDIVQIWFWILFQNWQSALPLVELCLSVFSRAIEWIDINFVTDENLIQALFSFLQIPELRNYVLQCFSDMCSKGMPVESKFDVLRRLDLIDAIGGAVESLPSFQESPSEDELKVEECDDFPLRVAELADTLLIEFESMMHDVFSMNIQLEEDIIEWIHNSVHRLVRICTRILSHRLEKVSESVIQSLKGFISKIRRGLFSPSFSSNRHRMRSNDPTLVLEFSEEQLSILVDLLRVSCFRLTVQEDVDLLDVDDDFVKEYTCFREEIGSIIKMVVRCIPEVSVSIISEIAVAVFSSPSSSAVEIEGMLNCLYHFSETCKDVFRVSQGLSDIVLMTLDQLLSSKVYDKKCAPLNRMFFEVISRFSEFFEAPQLRDNHLSDVIVAFLDDRGVRHPDKNLRAFACTLFKSFVKRSRAMLSSSAPEIVELFRELLFIDVEYFAKIIADRGHAAAQDALLHFVSELPLDSRLDLSSAAGSLLGYATGKIPLSEDRISCIQNFVFPWIEALRKATDQKLFQFDQPDIAIISFLCAHVVRSLGYFADGFSRPAVDLTEDESPEKSASLSPAGSVLLDMWSPVYNLLLEAGSFSISIRQQTIYFLHQVIEHVGVLICLNSSELLSPTVRLLFGYIGNVPSDLPNQHLPLPLKGYHVDAMETSWDEFSEIHRAFQLVGKVGARFRSSARFFFGDIFESALQCVYQVIQGSGFSSVEAAIRSSAVTSDEFSRKLRDVLDSFFTYISEIVSCSCLEAVTMHNNFSLISDVLGYALVHAGQTRNIRLSNRLVLVVIAVSNAILESGDASFVSDWNVSISNNLLPLIISVVANRWCFSLGVDSKALMASISSFIRLSLRLDENYSHQIFHEFCNLKIPASYATYNSNPNRVSVEEKAPGEETGEYKYSPVTQEEATRILHGLLDLSIPDENISSLFMELIQAHRNPQERAQLFTAS